MNKKEGGRFLMIIVITFSGSVIVSLYPSMGCGGAGPFSSG